MEHSKQVNIASFKDLIAWQEAMKLVKVVYDITNLLPKDELYILGSQMRRCAISIPSNIAEGFKRRSTQDYIHFLNIAFGSGGELETQLLLVQDLYPALDSRKVENALQLNTSVQKMLATIITKLKSKKL